MNAQHEATLRRGVLGPYNRETGKHEPFESNYVMDCTCGAHIGYATTSEATARRWMAEHLERHTWGWAY